METRTTFSKQIFSIMLSLIMVLSMMLYFPGETFSNMGFGLKASAAEVTLTEPSTDDKGVYQIGTAEELYWFADKVNNDNANYGSANAALTADITVNINLLGSLTFDSEGNVSNGTDFTSWTPIGNTESNGYTGIFDGQWHTISGLYFNDSNTSYVGLFGYNNGTVKNVGVVDPYFKGYWYVGDVCGYTYKGTIENCYNTGTVSGTYYIGGVCGENNDGTITNCYNAGTVSGTGSYVGGVCGRNVSFSIGNSSIMITNCYFDSNKYSGNAIGMVSSGTVTNVNGKTTEQFNSGEVAYLLSQGDNGSVWGQDLSITDSYPVLDSTKNVYRNETYARCKGNPGEPTYSYSNTAADPVYGKHSYDENGFCKDCGVYQPAEIINNAESTYNGYYAIENAGQLYWFADYVNGGNTSINAVLTSPITVNTGDVANCNGTKATGWIDWTPIGNSSNKYTGTFDGQGYTVSGLYFNNPDEAYVGLFGRVGSGGKVSCVGFADSYFKGNDYVGGICGENGGTITNCYYSGAVIAVNRKASVGGVCGYNEGTIINCYNSGNISAEGNAVLIGGVCADNHGTVTNCYYLSDTADENGGKTETQFNSGEVAYLLSQGTDGSVWGQTIGTENYPVLGGKKVLGNIDKSAFANDIIIYGQNAALDGTIGFNIYVSADDSYEWDKTIGGVTGVKNEEGLYVFTYNVAAKDMDENINFTVNDKIDVTVSVSDYLSELSKTDNELLKNLVDSMSNYGNAANEFFTDGGTVPAPAEEVTADNLSNYNFTVYAMEGITYYGSSLILQSETTIRHYFTIAEGKNISNFTFTVGGKETSLTESKNNPGYYYIDIKNISAEKLGEVYTVSINGEDVIIGYSALSYAKKVLDSSETDDNLKNLVKALYIYNQNALDYNKNAEAA